MCFHSSWCHKFTTKKWLTVVTPVSTFFFSFLFFGLSECCHYLQHICKLDVAIMCQFGFFFHFSVFLSARCGLCKKKFVRMNNAFRSVLSCSQQSIFFPLLLLVLQFAYRKKKQYCCHVNIMFCETQKSARLWWCCIFYSDSKCIGWHQRCEGFVLCHDFCNYFMRCEYGKIS